MVLWLVYFLVLYKDKGRIKEKSMYTHSVTLEPDKCIGCTDCIKRCPTEAIRVRGSKAKIIEERCIDCGNCIRICRKGAKKAITDEIETINRFKYKIALPAPAFYAQFPKAKGIEWILEALLEIGFTDYFEVAVAAEVITQITDDYLKQAKNFPVISSSCPAIVRLIQGRFPSLLPNVLPVISPMELAARYIKQEYLKKGIDPLQVGVFFISPCPAKATEIHQPKGINESMVDGVLSMQDLYKTLHHRVTRVTPKRRKQSTYRGISWATRNGGSDGNTICGRIAVDGIENVIEILEKVEDNTLNDVTFIEALACTGGCLGGALTKENAFVSRHTLKKWIQEDKKNHEILSLNKEESIKEKIKRELNGVFEVSIVPKSVFSLDDNRQKALEKMEKIEALYKKLPQIDCGSCGAPTCRCFAEDVVQQQANIEACIFMLRSKIKELSDQMYQLTQTVIPTHSEKK